MGQAASAAEGDGYYKRDDKTDEIQPILASDTKSTAVFVLSRGRRMFTKEKAKKKNGTERNT